MKFEQITYYLLIFSLAVLFLTAFIWTDELMSGWGISKILYVVCVSGFIGLILIARVIGTGRKDFVFQLNLIDLFILLLIGYIFLRLIFTEYISVANPYFIVLVVLAGIYFILKEILRESNEQPDRLSYVLIGSFLLVGLLQACYGLLQLYGVFPSNNAYFSITGSFVNPDHYAGFLVTVAPFSGGVYFLRDKTALPKWLSLLSAATFIACLLVLPATYIRGAWLAVIVGIGFIIAYKYDWWNRFKSIFHSVTKKVACATTGLVLLGLLGWGLYTLNPDSAEGRLLIWKVTTTGMISDHPIVGAGFNRFQAQYDNYQAAYFASDAGSAQEKWVAGNVKQAHNEYLQLWAEFGLIGLLLVGGLLISIVIAFREALKRYRNEDIDPAKTIPLVSAFASLGALAVAAFFSFPFHILPTAVNGIFLLALLSGLTQASKQYTINIKKTVRVLLVFIFLLSSMACFYYSYTRFNHYKQWKQVIQLAKYGVVDEHAASLFDRLYGSFQHNGLFLFHYGAFYARLEQYHQAIPLLEQAKSVFTGPHLYVLLGQSYSKIGKYKKAEAQFKHASFMIPHKMYPRYQLAKLYQKMGATEQALQIANTVLEMEAKVPTIAARQIKTKLRALKETAQRSTIKQQP